MADMNIYSTTTFNVITRISYKENKTEKMGAGKKRKHQQERR